MHGVPLVLLADAHAIQDHQQKWASARLDPGRALQLKIHENSLVFSLFPQLSIAKKKSGTFPERRIRKTSPNQGFGKRFRMPDSGNVPDSGVWKPLPNPGFGKRPRI
jgi:hypothetical protein